MLKITQHSGRPRWLNYEQVESIEEDGSGQTVINMHSGNHYVAMDSAADVVAALDAWYKTDSPVLSLADKANLPALKPETRSLR